MKQKRMTKVMEGDKEVNKDNEEMDVDKAESMIMKGKKEMEKDRQDDRGGNRNDK